MKEPNTLRHNYLKKANNEEKAFFITVLCVLASIDNKIKTEEIKYIEDLAQEAKTEVKPAFFKYTAADCLNQARQLHNRPLALALLKHMFVLAYTDNDFSDSEGTFICNISQALDIEPEKVQEISSWIIDRIIWLEQATQIFEE